jgi:hypothetical protein
MMTVLIILGLLALLCGILSAVQPSKCPLWIAVILLSIYCLVQQLPTGK